MIRISHELSIIRFYEEASDDMIPYVAVATIVWESADTVWIKAMHGDITRKMLRELATTLLSQNIRYIKAKREEGRSLPLGVRQEDGSFLIDLHKFNRQ